MTQKDLRMHFDYLESGHLIRKTNLANGCKAGEVVVGRKDSGGYLIVSFKNKNRKYHRMIFLWHHGYLPRCIDHINRIKDDNRIENLRAATTSQNMMNVEKTITKTTSRFKGVSWVKKHRNYISHIRHQGKLIHLGYYKTEEEAARAYDVKAKELYNTFAVLNFG